MVLAVKHILIYLLFLMLVELASITSFFNLCVSTFTIITHQEVHVTPLANMQIIDFSHSLVEQNDSFSNSNTLCMHVL